MNTVQKIVLLSLVLLFMAPAVMAQKRKIARADDAFENFKYDLALERYKKVAPKISSKKHKAEKTRVYWQIAECYRYQNNSKMAEPAYRRLERQKYYEKDSMLLLYYADALMQNNKVEKAKPYFEQFILAAPEDPRGPLGLLACDLLEEWTINPGKYEIILEKRLCTRDNDFGVCYSNAGLNEIFFTSSREEATGKKMDDWTGAKFTDLFVSKKDKKGKWLKPVLLDETEVVNTQANEGTPTMNSRFTTLYFTRCSKLSNGAAGCNVYKVKRQGKNWNEPVVEPLGGDSLSAIGHPTLTLDERVIIYAADFPEGTGGKDLWMAVRSSANGSFGDPIHIPDTINTIGDELFPHLRGDTVLYFSSNGHPGIGGLDIYRSKITWDKDKPIFSKPENLRTPVNSPKDDFGIIFNPEGEENGYFSSNRKGRGGDDIYSFNKEPVVFTISGVITNDRTLQVVDGVQVTMMSSDSVVTLVKSTVEGKYEFNKKQVFVNKRYNLEFFKEGYFKKTTQDSTIGLENSKNILVDMVLAPIPKDPIVLPEILYDLSKWDLKPQYEDSLQGLIRIMEDNPNIVVELAAHTDSRGSEINNDELSQKRAQSVVDYLIDRGIESDRLQAKGYGERVPLKLRDTVYRDGFMFPAGTRLTEKYINGITSMVQKEAAYQMNRRSEFSIVATNYVAGKGLVEGASPKVSVMLTNANEVPFVKMGKSNQLSASCMINGETANFIFDERAKYPSISVDQALLLLKAGVIGKENFAGDTDKILANGSVKTNSKFTIDELKIGQEVIFDVVVTVSTRQRIPLTIGLSTLSEFGNYTKDDARSVFIFEE